MNAEEFVAALHNDIVVQHVEMYENLLREAQTPTPEDDFLDSFLDEPPAPRFVTTLTPEQHTGYLEHVRGIVRHTVSSVLGSLDGSVPLGDERVVFQLIPAGGENIAGELNSVFTRRELAGTSSPHPDLAPAGIDSLGAPLTAEDFVDRVREVLFDELVPAHADLVSDIIVHADDPTADGYGTDAVQFLASLSEQQRAAYLSLRQEAVLDAATAVFGVLDGATASRGDYLRFEVIPPGGQDIAGDLQELFLIAGEDGPFGGRST